MQLRNFANDSTVTVAQPHASPSINKASIVAQADFIASNSTILNGVDKEQLEQKALKFLDDFYRSQGEQQNSELVQARIADIIHEIHVTGTYTHTFEELQYGARLAWRNHARCIGRAAWASLKVLDHRGTVDPKQMFKASLSHIKKGFNNGAIQPMITVFSPNAPLILNGQLLSFAAYSQEDGTVVGDPKNIDLTEMCFKLGWKPLQKRSHFDILPLIFYNIRTHELSLFEIPTEYHCKVAIEHPTITDISQLGLFWYSLPAVANMTLEIGGLYYATCPFNGWYMATEVGTRDFGDIQRYGRWVLPSIAKILSLDMSHESTLWKDRVVLELNIAVKYSFEKAGVTIVDHYTASHQFMKWHSTEVAERGSCPADWIWIVPPTSGSLCPVFHQEMVNYLVTPNYFYTDEAFFVQAWRQCMRGGKKLQITFHGLAVIVLHIIQQHKRTIKKTMHIKQQRIQVFYASETGTAKSFAQETTVLARRQGFEVKYQCISTLPNGIPKGSTANTVFLFIVATNGDGQSPSNCSHVLDYLKSKVSAECNMSYLQFAILALGNSTYKNFCAFGKQLEQCLLQLHARMLIHTVFADARSDQNATFRYWLQELMLFQPGSTISQPTLKLVAPTRMEKFMPGQLKEHFSFVKCAPANLAKDMSLVSLRVPKSSGSQFTYQPGAHLLLKPENCPGKVQCILEKLNLKSKANLCPVIVDECGMEIESRFPEGSTLEQIFTYFIDLSGPPSHDFICKLADTTRNHGISSKLRNLADRLNFETWVTDTFPNLLTLIDVFGKPLDVILILTSYPLIKERYYSIASFCESTLDICFNHAAVGNHEGLATTFLHGLNYDYSTLQGRITDGIFNFPKPQTDRSPVLMFAGGSGAAPFRSFLQYEHRSTLHSRNVTVLFLGVRTKACIPFYNEIKCWLEGSVLTRFAVATSRQKKCRHITAKLKNSSHWSREMKQWLTHEQGQVFVCGSDKFCHSVVLLLGELLDNERLVQEMRDNKRLQIEPFTSSCWISKEQLPKPA